MVRIKQLYELAYAAQEFFFLSLVGFSCEFQRPPSKITKRERQDRERKREARKEKNEERTKDGKRSVTGPKMGMHTQCSQRLCGISIDWLDR